MEARDRGTRDGWDAVTETSPVSSRVSRLTSHETALSWPDIAEARRRIAGVAHRTPVFHSRQFNEASGATVFFKAENLQRAGAFKFRGAYNKIRAELDRRAFTEVVAYSSGNHAQAVALVSKLLGVKATIVMPEDAPPAKLAATRGYGADVVLYDRYGGDREEIGERLQRDRDALLVPPFDDPLIMAGAGTATAELLEEVPELDFLVVPVSGGGLIAGSAIAAKHLRPAINVYGVEPETADDTAQSLARGSASRSRCRERSPTGCRSRVPAGSRSRSSREPSREFCSYRTPRWSRRFAGRSNG